MNIKEKPPSQLSICKLLMEETGCDENEAQLALSLSNNNMRDAILKVSVLSKFISAFKVKILMPLENIYGLMHIIINKRSFTILRFNAVFSQNPSVHEISLDMDWFSFEKSIFSARLINGIMEDYTKNTESELKQYLEESLEIAKFPSNDLIENFFRPIIVKSSMITEDLNLSEFRQLPNYSDKKTDDLSLNYKDSEVLKLESEICTDNKKGKILEQFKKEDMVLSMFSDKRDIAQYLTYMMKSYEYKNSENDYMKVFPAYIKQIKPLENNLYEVWLQYTPNLIGYATVKSSDKLKLFKKESPSFLKNILRTFKSNIII
jgi:hypothetical protein